MFGALGPTLIEKVRLANVRLPVSHPFRRNAYPDCTIWPDAAPGDMSEGYHPSNDIPLLSVWPGHGSISANCELRTSCGTVQSCKSRLVAVEKYHEACACGTERHTKVRKKSLSGSK